MPKHLNLDLYVTTSQAADTLDLKPDTVRKYCANFYCGATPAIKGVNLGGKWLISKKELARFENSR